MLISAAGRLKICSSAGKFVRFECFLINV